MARHRPLWPMGVGVRIPKLGVAAQYADTSRRRIGMHESCAHLLELTP